MFWPSNPPIKYKPGTAIFLLATRMLKINTQHAQDCEGSRWSRATNSLLKSLRSPKGRTQVRPYMKLCNDLIRGHPYLILVIGQLERLRTQSLSKY